MATLGKLSEEDMGTPNTIFATFMQIKKPSKKESQKMEIKNLKDG